VFLKLLFQIVPFANKAAEPSGGLIAVIAGLTRNLLVILGRAEGQSRAAFLEV